MKRRGRYIFRIACFILLVLVVQSACSIFVHVPTQYPSARALVMEEEQIPDSIQIRVATFLGNEKRNYYGDFADTSLRINWKIFLGKGTTIVSKAKGVEEWYGAGWTGQPLVVDECGKTFLIQGCYDHHLKKIDAATGEVVWQYRYDDILKGTGTLWKNDSAKNPDDRFLILQGSRLGVQNSQASAEVYSYRAVSYIRGTENWRMNIKRGLSYSRDVDASALILNDTAYLGLENATFIAFDPGRELLVGDSTSSPRIFQELPLYAEHDRARHGGNLVTEGSPARLGNHVYIASGAGHIYGYNLITHQLDWDFYTGSDIDGTPVVTADSCLLVTIEKQYIDGQGGVFKLNPRQKPEQAVVWYEPTDDFNFSSWKGGVIGSASVNDFYTTHSHLQLAAFTGIDGFLRVVRYDQIDDTQVAFGPDGKQEYARPKTVFTSRIGPSISTPILVGNKLIAAGYNGLHLFAYDSLGHFTKLAFQPGIFEATPVVDRGQIFIASRDGYLYCFGNRVDTALEFVPEPLLVKKEIKAETKKSNAQHVKQKNAQFVKVAPEWHTGTVAYTPRKKNTIIQEQHTVSLQPVNEGNCHLIGGVFRSKENAVRQVNLWKQRQYAASLIDSGVGLYYVSIARSTKESDLESILKQTQKQYDADVWIKVE
jgi:outer membrane protein assembly factor BamB